MINKKKILILGGTSQIAKELVLEFKNFKELEIIFHLRTKVASSFFKINNAEFIIGDLKQENILEIINYADLIVDFASPDQGNLEEIKFFYNNRLNLIATNMKKNSKFIFISSMNAFGIDKKRKILKNYFLSSSIYSASKRYAENIIKKLGKKYTFEVYILRLSEVHGNIQRASANIKKLIRSKYTFIIPTSPAWITFVSVIKSALINILNNKEKPGLYTFTCDDIYWNEILEYFGEQVHEKPKYFFAKKKSSFFKKILNFLFKIINSNKDFIRGNFNFSKEFEEFSKLNFRINKAKQDFDKIKGVKIYKEYNRYIGVLPGDRLKFTKYNKQEILKN